MFRSILLILISCLTIRSISSISPGRCPTIDPIEHFDTLKFCGRWYAVQETASKASCLTYDFLESSTVGEFVLEQSSEGYVKSLNVSYKVCVTGELVPDSTACNKMTLTYPLKRVTGTILFDVIATDYTTYAVVSSCQNAFWMFKRQTITFLSRTKTISAETYEKMIAKVQGQNFGDPKLKPVSHESCITEHNRELLKISSNPSVIVYESVANPVENEDENLKKIYFSGDPALDFLNNNEVATIIGDQ